MMNLWFLSNLNESFDHKISAVFTDKTVASVENTKDFAELTSDFINEEQRRLNQDGDLVTLVAGRGGRRRFNMKTCRKCQIPGHVYEKAPGPVKGYCFDHPDNKGWYKEALRRMQEESRSGNTNNTNPATGKRSREEIGTFGPNKARRVEQGNFSQPTLATDLSFDPFQ
jgi:hypothetical protein